MKKNLTSKRLTLNKETLLRLQLVTGGAGGTQSVKSDPCATSEPGQGGSNLGSCTQCINCPSKVSC